MNGNFKLKQIIFTDQEESIICDNILDDLLYQKVSYSVQDKEDLLRLIEIGKGLSICPPRIEIRENKFYILNLIKDVVDDDINKELWFDTPTDILRYLAFPNTSLSDKIEIKKMKRKDRKLVMKLLNNMIGKDEDIIRYRREWKKLAHIVHPYEYKHYKIAYGLFKVAMNNEKVETFNSKLSEAKKNKNIGTMIKLLKTRPTEFVKNINFMLNNFTDKAFVLHFFSECIDSASTNSIISLINNHMNTSDYKLYTPKATDMKFFTKESNSKISEDISNLVVKVCKEELKRRFSEKENIGKVYLDDKLKQFNIPLQIRNSSKGQKVFARWSRFDLPKDKNFIRSFIHWKNMPTQRVDVDSAFSILDRDGNVLDYCAYNRVKPEFGTMWHSGDITDGRHQNEKGEWIDGATEYVDIDLKKTKQIPNAKYVLMNVYSFTGQPMKDIPECFGGWMFREDVQSGEIYEPKTADHIFEFNNNGTSVIPMAIDLETNQVIWLDINSNSSKIGNNIRSDSESLQWLVKGLDSKKNYMSLFDLFRLHHNRYEVVDNKEDADVVFDELSIEEVLNNYL